jgi:hypothetical protein
MVLWRARRKIRCARFCFAFSGRNRHGALNLAGSIAAFAYVQYRQATHFVRTKSLAARAPALRYGEKVRTARLLARHNPMENPI